MKSGTRFENWRSSAQLLLALVAVGCLLTSCGSRVGVSTATREGGVRSGPAPTCPAVRSEAAPRLLRCSVTAGGSEPLVDDFDDGDLFLLPIEQRVGAWYRFTDETTGCATLTVEKNEASPALHFRGGGFSAWGAGFGVALAWSDAQRALCGYDASAYSGIRFRARGNTSLRMTVASRASAFVSAGGDCPDSEGCFDQQGRTLSLSSDFQVFDISFCSLAQEGFGTPLGSLDSTQITNVHFLAKTQGNFDVWLDDVELIPWQEGQSRACRAVCPADELAPGIRPQPKVTSLAQDSAGALLSTFEQPTKDCGPITRRYFSHIPKSVGRKSDAPVLIVLHGLGADAESMRQYITVGRFETLADRDGFVVVYGNAAPSSSTVAERPNGGGFRKDPRAFGQVDDIAYLKLIIEDLTAKGAISGKNPVFLAGLSDGGGLVHMAALHASTRFRGIAEIMPFPGPTVPLPPANGGFELQRVLVAYSETDPGMATGYAKQLAKLGPAWAAALSLSPEEQRAPHIQALPDGVKEGDDYRGSAPKAKLTRDSRATQVDYGSKPSGAQVRVLILDHAGHLWPVPNPPDREQEIALFGLRNQDIDMSDVIWEFFRSSL